MLKKTPVVLAAPPYEEGFSPYDALPPVRGPGEFYHGPEYAGYGPVASWEDLPQLQTPPASEYGGHGYHHNPYGYGYGYGAGAGAARRESSNSTSVAGSEFHRAPSVRSSSSARMSVVGPTSPTVGAPRRALAVHQEDMSRPIIIRNPQPHGPVTYLFSRNNNTSSAANPGAMILCTSTAPRDAVYRISIAPPNPFSPLSSMTVVERAENRQDESSSSSSSSSGGGSGGGGGGGGRQRSGSNAPSSRKDLVAQFETGLSTDPALAWIAGVRQSLQMFIKRPKSSNKAGGSGSGSGSAVWTWNGPHFRFKWELSEVPYVCGHGATTDDVQCYARFTPPTLGTSSGCGGDGDFGTLEVLPGAHDKLDEIVVSLILVEQLRRIPETPEDMLRTMNFSGVLPKPPSKSLSLKTLIRD